VLTREEVYRDAVCAGETCHLPTLQTEISRLSKTGCRWETSETVDCTASPQSGAELFEGSKFGNEAAARLGFGYQEKFLLPESLAPWMNLCRRAQQSQRLKVASHKESVLVDTWECNEEWLTFVTICDIRAVHKLSVSRVASIWVVLRANTGQTE
jgi:hypothetical protein